MGNFMPPKVKPRGDPYRLCGAFHGRTLSALAAAGNGVYLAGLGPAPGVFFVQCPDFTMAAQTRAVDGNSCGFWGD
ncbi:MAG: hypothetical protein CM15mP21_5510 [Hyphomicrobiales bacterium]|nr:MAG: hypothetical protein CM15mP21_5510 [Hyphomicrobiales bacterium]